MRIRINKRPPCRCVELHLRLYDPGWNATVLISMTLVRYPTDPTAPQEWTAYGSMQPFRAEGLLVKFQVSSSWFEDWVTEEDSDEYIARAVARILLKRHPAFFRTLSATPARQTAWTRLLTSEL
jgi:hypothetical protein